MMFFNSYYFNYYLYYVELINLSLNINKILLVKFLFKDGIIDRTFKTNC